MRFCFLLSGIFFCAAAAFLLLGKPLCADPLPEGILQQDPRLSKTITLTATRIYVGELAEQLSRQSGVSITAGGEDGAGDTQVCVSLHAVPLADAMNALWSLVSYQNADWDWEKSGEPGRYRYRLVQTDAARGLSALIRKQVQEQFVGQTDEMLAALKMTPDQLKEAAKDNRLLASLSDGKDDRVRPSLMIFASLTPQVQSSILNDQAAVSIPVSALPQDGRDFVHQKWLQTLGQGGMTKDQQGNWTPVPEPQFVAVSCSREADEIAPHLNIDFGFGGGDLTGGGWMEKDWQNQIALMWMRAGDRTDDPASARRIFQPSNGLPKTAQKHPLAHHLEQLAQSLPLSMIARLPDDRGGNSAADLSPYGLAAADYLSELKDGGIMHKWRKGILLLTSTEWLCQDDSGTNAVWPLIKILRESENKNDGYLTLDDLAEAASQLNVSQLHALSEHFPVMDTVASLRKFLAEYYSSPSIRSQYLSKAGSNWNGGLRVADEAMGPSAESLVQDGTVTRVRIIQQQHEDWKPPVHEIEVQLLTNSGAIKAQTNVSYPAHQWRSSMDSSDNPPAPSSP